MNDVTVQLPRNKLLMVYTVWLCFTGYFFFNLPARPLAGRWRRG